jgi:CsoR family transcriptional regulator, copper-sensing transcriptional repressor
MKIQDATTKEKLLHRLNRIEGQVRGVQAMLQDERECREIMQQLIAIHSAMQSASRTFFQEYASACLLDLDGETSTEHRPDVLVKREKLLQEMVTLLDKVP